MDAYREFYAEPRVITSGPSNASDMPSGDPCTIKLSPRQREFS